MNTIDIQLFRDSLRRIERSLIENIKGESQCCGVSLNECHVLLAIDESCCLQENPVSNAELVDRLKIDKSILSRTIDSLVRKEYLLREEDPRDRRQKNLKLSGKGQKKTRYINDLMNGKYRELLNRTSENNQKKLIDAVLMLADTLDSWKKELQFSCCDAEQGRNGKYQGGKE